MALLQMAPEPVMVRASLSSWGAGCCGGHCRDPQERPEPGYRPDLFVFGKGACCTRLCAGEQRPAILGWHSAAGGRPLNNYGWRRGTALAVDSWRLARALAGVDWRPAARDLRSALAAGDRQLDIHSDLLGPACSRGHPLAIHARHEGE